MNRMLSLLCSLCLLNACRNNDPAKEDALSIARDGLTQSLASSKVLTTDLLLAIKGKKLDPQTSTQAGFWEPKALAIDQHATQLTVYMEKIKEQLWLERNKSSLSKKTLQQTAALPLLVAVFRDSLLQNNPYLRDELSDSLVLFTKKIDQQIQNGKTLNQLLFQSSSPLEASALLSRFQLNIQELARENTLSMLRRMSARGFYCTFITPIIAQSHQVIPPNGRLSLDVALGEIRYHGVQSVLLNGKAVSVNERGIYHATITAPSVAGKYRIPVVASYTDQDGKESTFRKILEYEVVDCTNNDK